jgi:enoyl-CoA hydratase/carnithine racemase
MTPDELRSAGLVYEVTGEVAVVTLDRPAVRNAQTPAMWRALAAIGEQVADDVRVVVVRGSGQTFSAGLDRAMLDPSGAGDGVETVAGLLAMSDEDASAAIEQFQRGFTWLRDPRFVSIAVVQGYAIGAGFQLALSCDLRVLAEDAQLCMKESALGLVPDLTGTQPLVDAVGYARALEICATARMVSAEEAMAIGLANVVVPVGELEATVTDLAAALTAALPGAVRETKELLLAASSRTLDEQRRFEREAQVRRFRELAAMLREGSRGWPSRPSGRAPGGRSGRAARWPTAPTAPRTSARPRRGPGGCRTRRTRRRRGRPAGRRWR